ncbi:MAG: ATP phosphoribosyltransferase regulatory subunit [Clostridia bacterium]|nr:ATP phosphoribosyltransferase regulatory subunit [Clostridia bacterium]
MAYYKLPLGVQDLLPEECYNLNLMKAKLQSVFEGAGYSFVSTAILDYYDTYSDISNRIAQEKMFKLTDSDGKLLVLRPDMTLSLARMATKHHEKHSKLCYFSNIWNAMGAGGLSSREVLQAGVECFGRTGAFADAQLIALAVESLLSLGVKNFIIDLGHVGFFKGLLEEYGFDDEQVEAIRLAVNAKDIIGASEVVKGTPAEEAVLALPTLFGGVEVLDRAQALTASKSSLDALCHLRKVYELLASFGYEKYISIDLGTVKSLSYYSGIVFTGLVRSIGAPVLSGGRYDNLARDFASDFSAVGFAIGLKRILLVLERQNDLLPLPKADVTVIVEEGAEREGYALYQKLRAQGKSVDLKSGEREEGAYYVRKGENV